jgi:hypothetical protein
LDQNDDDYKYFTPDIGKYLTHVIYSDEAYINMSNLVDEIYRTRSTQMHKPYLINVTLKLKLDMK